jgi:hypothetical protein
MSEEINKIYHDIRSKVLSQQYVQIIKTRYPDIYNFWHHNIFIGVGRIDSLEEAILLVQNYKKIVTTQLIFKPEIVKYMETHDKKFALFIRTTQGIKTWCNSINNPLDEKTPNIFTIISKHAYFLSLKDPEISIIQFGHHKIVNNTL